MLLVGPPGGPIPPGVTIADRLIELRDIMPTLLDCADLPIPATVEGSSILSLARGDRPPWRDHLHGEHPLFGQSLQWLTNGHHKYVWHSGTGREQLFDLTADPHELHDLAAATADDPMLTPWRDLLAEELHGREEGYVRNGRLVTGRPPQRILSQPGPPNDESRSK